jgi:perosamine synthetase
VNPAEIDAVAIPTTATIRECLAAIDRGALGFALLVDEGRFAGLVTDGDARRALLAGASLDDRAADLTRPTAKTATVHDSREQVAAAFTEKIRVVPILDDDGRVVDVALFDRRARLPVAEPFLGERELAYVTECITSGWVSSAGAFVTRFEEAFADFCGSRHAVSVSNGTTALHVALVALGVGPGDEVIVPTLTFIATANAVTYTGATPVLVDSDPDTWTIDPAAIEAAVTPRTRAIVPVHLYGHPADLDRILAVAAARGVAVVEDAAEAHGATYRGRRVGTFGVMGIFSFYGNKIFTTGEGGMVVTDDDDLAAQLRILRAHGMSETRRYWHPVLGFNYRLTNLQAALGLAQIERADEILAAKRDLAKRYDDALRGVPGLTLPPDAEWATSVHWLYSILVDRDAFGMSRDELQRALDDRGIETRPFFVPIHEQPLYAHDARQLPVAEELARRGLSLPSAVGLGADEIARVAETIAALARSAVAG